MLVLIKWLNIKRVPVIRYPSTNKYGAPSLTSYDNSSHDSSYDCLIRMFTGLMCNFYTTKKNHPFWMLFLSIPAQLLELLPLLNEAKVGIVQQVHFRITCPILFTLQL
ncbi:hypothetical protein COL05_28905 [Bacillus sp. AFS059628]|nr:hypothetical protein COL05_28905 [Bacillus sp. AFS059628]